MKQIKIILAAIAFSFMLTGGVVSIVTGAPSAKKSESKKVQAGDFIRGVRIWADNCTRCHNLRDPKEFNDREWQVVMTHMRVRAGLTGQEMRDVLAFMQQSN